MKVILLGLTGLGNAVLKGLLNSDRVKVNSVYTKKYEHPYPYYDEIQIETLCRQNNIKCYLDKKLNSKDVLDRIKQEQPDLIIASSFDQILSKQLIDIPKLGIINLHPSLLPKYRGPYPDQAVLLNGETKTGVTVHFLTENLDSGNIILQKDLYISSDDNYSSLKRKIAVLSGEIIPEVLNLFAEGHKPEGLIQNEKESSYFPKPKAEDAYLESETSIVTIKNKMRALNPFPGTSILIGGKRIRVNKFELLKTLDSNNGLTDSETFVDVRLNSCGIRLFKKN
ncbi:MAG: methionyl-tRNA formyltransferase [bacterium]